MNKIEEIKRKEEIQDCISKQLLLTKEDYEFVRFFCELMKIPEGRGTMILLEVFLNTYKKDRVD